MSIPKLSPPTFLLLLAALLAACGGAPAEATATLPAPEVATEAPAEPTATSQPGLVILLAPEDANADLAAQAAGILQSYAAERGLLFEQQASLDPAALPDQLSALAALPPAANLGELAAAAPQAQFVAIGFDPGTEAANLIPLSTSSANPASAAFLAGYTAAIATEDWRVGVLYAPGEDLQAEAFRAGAEYFCGSCVPQAPPLEEYPASIQADPANWQASLDTLLGLSVRTIYLTPAVESAEIVQYIASWNALALGQGAAPAGLEANWLASVSAGQGQDLAQTLPAALDGQAPAAAGLGLSQANAAYLSEGRIAFIRELLAELEAGEIQPPPAP